MQFVLAYIDPGSGSLVIQAVIAGLVAAPIFFRKQITRMVRRLRGESGSASEQAAADDTNQGG